MNEKAKKSKALKEFWSERLAHWQISGKNGMQWCKEQGLSYGHFNYWKKELLIEQNPTEISKQFSELEDEPSGKISSGIRIQHEEFLLHVDVDFDAETLRRLILLLERAFPC